MTLKVSRKKVLESVEANIQDKNMIKHMLATGGYYVCSG